MIIRQQQSDVFRKQALESFYARLQAHLDESFPDRCAQLGEAQVRQEIERGCGRAAGYRIEDERDVAAFVHLMFLLRSDFDSSPETPWAATILGDHASSAENRLRRLQLKAREHLARRLR